MISDESSSDSETGRFKSSQAEKKIEQSRNVREENFRSTGRGRSENDRFRRDFDRRRDDREHGRRDERIQNRRDDRDQSRRDDRDQNRRDDRDQNRRDDRDQNRRDDRDQNRDRLDRPREPHRPPRPSPPKRRHSRERESRDKGRRSHDRLKPYEDNRGPTPRETRSSSKDKKRHQPPPRTNKSPETKRVINEEITPSIQSHSSREDSYRKHDRARSRDKMSSSPDMKSKRSVVQKPTPVEPRKPAKPESPIDVDKHANSEEEVVQAGSYYSMKPAVVNEKSVEKEASEESSEIDSSDDERLRAKLLNLERELSKTRKKKHKKKHKRKSSKSKNDKDKDTTAQVEVTSTTDIQEKDVTDGPDKAPDVVEVTSTQKSAQKDSSEEGEISSGDESHSNIDIDPADLRHKLKRTVPKADLNKSPDLRERLKSKPETSGPALPPNLDKIDAKGDSPDVEGPALPPHLKRGGRKNIGPTIPNELRKVLAEADPDDVKYVSSDDDAGIGPLPAGAESKWTDAHQKLEERALDMKIKKLDGHTLHDSNVKSRETWMLELPEAKAKIMGLEARSFRAKEGPDMSDRSTWTDTPEEKARKIAGELPEEDRAVSLHKEARARHIDKRDDEQEKEAKKHKKKHKREESLLELHQKKLKKKKKKDEREDGSKERRPFSRDVDLQVNRFDEAQKKSIIKKAQALDTRFGRGEAKYL